MNLLHTIITITIIILPARAHIKIYCYEWFDDDVDDDYDDDEDVRHISRNDEMVRSIQKRWERMNEKRREKERKITNFCCCRICARLLLPSNILIAIAVYHCSIPTYLPTPCVCCMLYSIE